MVLEQANGEFHGATERSEGPRCADRAHGRDRPTAASCSKEVDIGRLGRTAIARHFNDATRTRSSRLHAYGVALHPTPCTCVILLCELIRQTAHLGSGYLPLLSKRPFGNVANARPCFPAARLVGAIRDCQQRHLLARRDVVDTIEYQAYEGAGHGLVPRSPMRLTLEGQPTANRRFAAALAFND